MAESEDDVQVKVTECLLLGGHIRIPLDEEAGHGERGDWSSVINQLEIGIFEHSD